MSDRARGDNLVRRWVLSGHSLFRRLALHALTENRKSDIRLAKTLLVSGRRPPRCSRRRGQSVAPDPLARPVLKGRNTHDGRKPSQVASARRLPLRATRFGEAGGRTAPLLAEPESAPSITTQPHCEENIVRGTGGGPAATSRPPISRVATQSSSILCSSSGQKEA